MPSYKRPGVYAEEVLNLSQALTAPGMSATAFIGANNRGPVIPTLIQSWSEYLAQFGGFSAGAPALPYAVHQYFSNGGRVAWVTRVAGPASTASTRTLNDTTTTVPTLKLDAANPGTWGQGIYIEVTAGATGRFNLTVYFGGNTADKIVERWTDLSMDNADPRYAIALINSITSGSLYVKATDMNSVTAAPGDNPAVVAPIALTGPASDPVATGTELAAAIALLDTVEGPLTINMPGVTTLAGADNLAVLTGTLLPYCSGRGDCFAVVDPDQNLTPANAVTAAGGLSSAYAALYYPWIYVADPGSSAPGAMRKIAPGGSVAGQFARTDTLRGIHKAPAGMDTRLAGVVGVETKLTNTNLDDLNTGLVNAIRQIPGAGIVIMGARTLRNTAADRYVPTRRTLNYIRKALLDGTRWAVFEPNDSTLWGGLSTNIQAFLLSMWQRKALRGNSSAEAFYVKCDASNNTEQSIQSGQVNIEVGVALQFPAEFVVIRIGQWQGGSTAVVTV